MTNKPRAWYQKKRYWLTAFFLIIFGLGVLGGNSSSAVEAPSPTQIQKVVPTTHYQTPVSSTNNPTRQPQLSNNNYYTNVSGNVVHSPAYSNNVPSDASAQCRDGTYSFSQHRQGTCSHHGGVSHWI